jgi:two-component system, OmpR family, sensor histidine kinase KdpD
MVGPFRTESGRVQGVSECLVVCVGPSPGSERLVRATKHLADELHGARWYAVHVAPTNAAPTGQADRDRIENHLALAETLGAECAYVVGDSIADSLLEFAREHGATRIIAGKPTHPRWRDRVRGSMLGRLIRDSGAIEIHVIAPTDDMPRRTVEPRPPAGSLPYARAVLAIGVATAIGLAVGSTLSIADHAMVYLAAIVIAALGGRGPGLLAATLAVATFNFFFIPPRYTFAVADVEHVITFVVMFVVGTATGTVVARLRHAAGISRQRERRTSALLAFTSAAAGAKDASDVAAAVVAHVEATLGAPAVVRVPNERGELEALAGLEPIAPVELLEMPLSDGETTEGVLAIHIGRARRRLDLDTRTLIEALARQAAVALARIRLARTAEESTLRAKAEEMRSSLLSTVSHDLRTPVAIISGLASTVRDGARDLTDEQRESLDTVVDEAGRLGSILHNLLAITRVESGAVLERDWVPLEEIVGTALARCETVVDGRAVELEVDADVGACVEPVLFEQLLINLVENAAKHTPAGKPITIRARRDGSDAVIEVSDRGPGLPPGAPEQLFEKFVRGPGVRTKGAGLGLAVCRGIAHAHGGTITAESRDGGGATFRVRVAAGEAPLVAAELAS